MKGYIYLIENKVNGKKYVGKTYGSISRRWSEHLSDMNRELTRPLYRAMRKYGIDSFEIREVEFTDNPEEREKYWISYYDSYNNGYNATLGGDGRLTFPYTNEEVIQKYYELKSANKVALYFKCDCETILVRLRNSNIPLDQDFYVEDRSWRAKKVRQYSLEGDLLRSFSSYSEAARWLIENKITEAQVKHIVTNISKVCRKVENRKQTYGFKWELDANS